MKRVKRLVILFVLRTVILSTIFLVNSSCNSENENLNDVLIVDFNKELIKSEITLSKIAKEIKYTELESTPDSYIGQITQVIFNKNHIIIFDRFQQKVFLFDNNGTFISKIGQRGNGPDEYVHAFGIDCSNDQIFIHSSSNSIQVYNLNNEFIRSIPINETKFQHFKIINNLCVFATPFPITELTSGNSLGIQKFNGDICYSAVFRVRSKEHLTPSLVSNTQFYAFSDTVYYWEYIYDTVYCLSSNQMAFPKYVFNLKENSVPPEAFQNIKSLNEHKRSGKFFINSFIDSHICLFFNCLEEKRKALYLYCKNDSTLTRVKINEANFPGITNDIDNGLPFWPFWNHGNNIVIGFLEPSQLIELRESNNESLQGTHEQLRQIINKVTIKSNYILTIVELR